MNSSSLNHLFYSTVQDVKKQLAVVVYFEWVEEMETLFFPHRQILQVYNYIHVMCREPWHMPKGIHQPYASHEEEVKKAKEVKVERKEIWVKLVSEEYHAGVSSTPLPPC